MRKIHLRVYAERQCPVCKKGISVFLHDYGDVTPANLDEKVGVTNFPIDPIRCPGCGREELPDYLATYNGDKLTSRLQIGTRELPVVGKDLPYGMVLSPEEQAEQERGMAKVIPLFEKQGEEFWEKYCQYALDNWRECMNELISFEFAEAYRALNFKGLPANSTAAAWRRDALKRLDSDQMKIKFWRLANQELIDEFLWDGNAPSWPVENWVKKYGRTRITFIVLHFPLPEELENVRTEKLSMIIRKKSGDTGVLFQRIGHLGKELDRQRHRTEELSRILLELRQEKAAAEDALGDARKKFMTTEKTVYNRDPDDARKIREFKGLIHELRAEVKRLESLVPEMGESPQETEDAAAVETIREGPVSPDILAGKMIAVFGWLKERQETVCQVVWHDGDQADQMLERMAVDADGFVVLTRFISHEAMWRLKELAIDMDKPILFSKGTNIEIILARVARLFHMK